MEREDTVKRRTDYDAEERASKQLEGLREVRFRLEQIHDDIGRSEGTLPLYTLIVDLEIHAREIRAYLLILTRLVLIGIIVLTVAILAGCATPTTGIVPLGEELYKVTRQGEGFWVTTDGLKTAALLEASQYCESRRRAFKTINIKEIPAGALGRWPEVEVVFSCPATAG